MFRLRAAPLIVAATVLIVVAVSLVWRTVYAVSGPTPEDYRIYSAFLPRLAAQHGWRTSDMGIARATSVLSAPTADSWVPAALHPYPLNRLAAPEDVVRFCGKFCGRDFMKKNLVKWQLKPGADGQFPFDIISTPGATGSKRVVSVTRAGFDLWHRQAVLMYTVDCSEASAGVPTMCTEFGHAFLQKTNGTWNINELKGFDF